MKITPKIRKEIIISCRKVKYPYGFAVCPKYDEVCDRLIDKGKCELVADKEQTE